MTTPPGCVERIIENGKCVCSGCARRRKWIDAQSKERSRSGTQDTYVESSQAVRHLRSLINFGISCEYIGLRVGYHRTYVSKLARLAPKRDALAEAKHRKISSRRAEAIEELYVEIVSRRKRGVYGAGKTGEMVRNGAVPSRLSRLAIQGMQAQGWSLVWIANQIQTDTRHIQRILTKHSLVLEETESKLVALARKVGSAESTEKFALRTKNFAARRGYLPTMYTDDLV